MVHVCPRCSDPLTSWLVPRGTSPQGSWPSKRWPAASRWWPPPSAGSRRRSSTARPASWSHRDGCTPSGRRSPRCCPSPPAAPPWAGRPSGAPPTTAGTRSPPEHCTSSNSWRSTPHPVGSGPPAERSHQCASRPPTHPEVPVQIDPTQWRVLVTGGSSGLGAAVCRRLGEQGASVASLDRAVSEHVWTIQADLSDSSAAERATGEALAHLGGLDAVVTCAGIDVPGPFGATDGDTWNRI